MQVKSLSFARGMQWVGQGLALLKRYPLVLFMCAFVYLFTLIFSSVVPLIGAVLPLVLSPIMSLGLTQIARQADKPEVPRLSAMFEPFKAYKTLAFRHLLILGGINAVVTLIALSFAGLFDDGMLMKLATGQVKPDDPSVQGMSLLMPVFAFFAAYTPMQMALWFSPLFIAWHQQSVMQSMFYSIAAVWRSRSAFLGYLIAWLGLSLAMAGLILVLNLLLGRSSIVAQYLVAPVPIFLFSVFYCSFWFSYKDSIDETAERA